MNFAQDRLAVAVSESPRVRKLLIAEPYRSGPVAAVRRAQGRRRASPTRDQSWMLSPLRLRRHDPVDIEALKRTYQAYDRKMQRLAQRRGLDRPAVLTSNPFLVAYCELDWAGPVTFYATDDWPSAYDHRGWRDAFVDAFRVVGQRGIAVAAVSQTIIDRINPSGPAIAVPNGLEPREWTHLPPPPSWFEELPHPRLIYVGTLDSRLDTEMLAAGAAELGGAGSIALVGPTYDRVHVDRVASLPGITVHDRVDRRGLTGLLGAADLSIIPHVRMPFTEAMSPLKLYEAVAAGLPVVATDLEPMRDVDPSVTLVSDPPSFAVGIREALARGRATEDERLTFVEANSWALRHEEVLELALRDR